MTSDIGIYEWGMRAGGNQEILKRMKREDLAYTLSIIRDTLPFHGKSMDQHKTPDQLYFIRPYVIKHVLVSETSLFATPKSGTASFCMLFALF